MSGFIARSHVLQYGVYRVGYAVVSLAEVIEAKFLLGKPLRSWLNGLIALTRAFFFFSKNKRVTIKTDSKYAFLVFHARVAIWVERGLLRTL